MPEMTITHHATLSPDLIEQFYEMYSVAFTPLTTRAAARHLLTADEFAAEMRNERLDKLIASRDGAPVGLATATADLSVIPWIEPQFYLSRWGDKAARGALFYLGYALATRTAGSASVFISLIDTVAQRVADVGGTVCWDACEFNAARAVRRINERVANYWGAPVETVDTHEYSTMTFEEQTGEPHVEVVDTQTYYVAHFDNIRQPAATS